MAAVLVVAAAIAILRVAAASERVISWVLVAATLAGLAHPASAALARRLPRGLAIAIVAVVALVVVVMVVYAVVSSVARETQALQVAAPKAAEEIERSGRFSGFARDFELAAKTRHVVDAIPDRVFGGPGGAFRTAADMAVTASIVGILSIFFLLQGPELVWAGLRQVRDPRRRVLAERVVPLALRRGFSYTRRKLATAVLAGLAGVGIAVLFGLPAPVPLALWLALWSIVPLVGCLIGGLPLVGLAAIPSLGRTTYVLAAVVVLQVAVEVVRNRWIERGTVRVGPFVATAAVLVGLELRQAEGAVLMLLAVSIVVAAADQLADERETGLATP